MKFKYREPSIGLSVGTLPSDLISDAIHNAIGVREVARMTSLSATTISLWAAGKSMLPWSTAMRIADAVALKHELWLATLYDRVQGCERLGFDFHDRTNDEPARSQRENIAAGGWA